MDYPKYSVTADIIACYPDGKIIFIRRGHSPYEGMYALPGGYVEPDETIEQCILREVEEEIGLDIEHEHLTLVGVYSQPERDPRGRTISVCFIAPVPEDFVPKAGSDAATVEILNPTDVTPDDVAFDHYRMLVDADLL